MISEISGSRLVKSTVPEGPVREPAYEIFSVFVAAASAPAISKIAKKHYTNQGFSITEIRESQQFSSLHLVSGVRKFGVLVWVENKVAHIDACYVHHR
jgi:hypothetical protein